MPWETSAVLAAFLTIVSAPSGAEAGAEAQALPMTTLLRLSAAGSVQVAPDRLVAQLVASSTSTSAATAQRDVNALIAGGMTAARAVTSVEARATGYSVSPVDEKHLSWVAQQTLELRGPDATALLDLAGRLQERGLAMAGLEWQLSPSLRQQAHDEATIQALRRLQAQAASAAATLGLHVDHLQEVRLDGLGFQPRQPAGMMAMARMASPPPQATAAPEAVDAEVSADVLLRP